MVCDVLFELAGKNKTLANTETVSGSFSFTCVRGAKNEHFYVPFRAISQSQKQICKQSTILFSIAGRKLDLNGEASVGVLTFAPSAGNVSFQKQEMLGKTHTFISK